VKVESYKGGTIQTREKSILSDIKREMMMDSMAKVTGPKKQFAVRLISPRTVHFCVNGHSLFISPVEARNLMAEIDAALDGPGPEVICEVVR